MKYNCSGEGGSSDFVQRLDEAVNKARKKEEWRVEYMTLQMIERERFSEGRAEGRATGAYERDTKDDP